MTQTIKVTRQSKFEFIANNKVCIVEEVPVNTPDYTQTNFTEVITRRKNEQTGEESVYGRLGSTITTPHDAFTYTMTGRNLDVPINERLTERQQALIDRQQALIDRQQRQAFINSRQSNIGMI